LALLPSAFDHWPDSALIPDPMAASAITLRVGSVSTMRRIVARGEVHIVKKAVIDPPAPFAIETPVPVRIPPR
jgi:hypothetical protein